MSNDLIAAFMLEELFRSNQVRFDKCWCWTKWNEITVDFSRHSFQIETHQEFDRKNLKHADITGICLNMMVGTILDPSLIVICVKSQISISRTRHGQTFNISIFSKYSNSSFRTYCIFISIKWMHMLKIRTHQEPIKVLMNVHTKNANHQYIKLYEPM